MLLLPKKRKKKQLKHQKYVDLLLEQLQKKKQVQIKLL